MEYFLIISGIILLIGGFIGCFTPIIPGPPLSYLALISLHFAKDNGVYSAPFLVGLFILTISITVLDYLIPATKAKYVGASKYGTIGAFIGMTIGTLLFYFSTTYIPLGIIVGSFIGTMIGEYIFDKKNADAIKSNSASTTGFIVATVMKFSMCGTATFFFFKYI